MAKRTFPAIFSLVEILVIIAIVGMLFILIISPTPLAPSTPTPTGDESVVQPFQELGDIKNQRDAETETALE